jgi:hypothetical protein
MNNNQSIAETFRKIQEDPQNTICFDCGINDVTHSSVSLGILLCKGCASVHKTLIPEISSIKVIDSSYSILDLQSLLMGGNASLKSFFAMYAISCNDSIEYKYRTKACAYYIEMLKMMVSDSPCTMLTPSESEGADLCSEYSSILYGEDRFEESDIQIIPESLPPLQELHSPISIALRKVESFAGEMKEKGMNFFKNFRKSN